jgi:hypothetical protein
MRFRNLIVPLLLLAVPLSVQATVLITPQEAKLPPAQSAAAAGGAGAFAGDRGTPTRGPDLVVQSPKTAVSSPFPFHLVFTPHNGRKIDPASVTVTLLTQPEVDLTGRVQPFLTATGVDFKQAEVPPGQYRIRIDLTDDAGHAATKTLDLQVLQP